MEDFILTILEFFGQAWWVEIKTESPQCVYYFGPFVRKKQAQKWKPGYVEDLEGEGAKIVSLEIKQCRQPSLLTDDQEESKSEVENKAFPTLSRNRIKSFHE